jgi:hypothetical protein
MKKKNISAVPTSFLILRLANWHENIRQEASAAGMPSMMVAPRNMGLGVICASESAFVRTSRHAAALTVQQM